VESNEIPADDGTTINYLWLAYASRCYFSGLSTNHLIPIWMLDDPSLRDAGYTVPAIWQLQTRPPQLPARVIYLNDGTHRTVSADHVPITFRYAAPFDQGFTNAEYQVQASTNVDGLVIPTEFTFTRYYVQGEHLIVRTLTQGNATVVRKGTTVSEFRPQFEGRAIAFDKRFRKEKDPVPSVRYWVTNGEWLAISNLSNAYLKQLAKYKGAKEVAASLRKRRNAKRVLVVSVMFLVAVLPPVLIVLATKRHKDRQNMKNEMNQNENSKDKN
jgi:hypothetical protein